MKAITTQAIIGTVRSKVDRSISFTVSTPELTPEEVALFFQLQGINVTLTITPEDEPQAPSYTVDKDIQSKTPSQRLRAVLFLLWRQKQTVLSFDQFYASEMEQFIEIVKGGLDSHE